MYKEVWKQFYQVATNSWRYTNCKTHENALAWALYGMENTNFEWLTLD